MDTKFPQTSIISIDTLPNIIPLFPLSGVILLPGRELPLHIFEPRYLAMVRSVLDTHRMIGVIQPLADDEQGDGTGELYRIGGAGKIMEWYEREDETIELVLTGVSRFAMIEEVDGKDGYRRALVDWHRFGQDLHANQPMPHITSEEVVAVMERFFEANGLEVEWNNIDSIPGHTLIDVLIMNLPFPPEDKQALLEAPTISERYKVLRALAAMSGEEGFGSQAIH